MASNKILCGIGMPQVFIDPPVNVRLIRDFLARAETLGYESAWVQEQILSDFPVLESVSLLNYAAALTSKLRLGTSVLLTVLRNPIQLAKSLSTLDQLSQGRLTVGIGLGGRVGGTASGDESVFGYSSERRVQRFVEGIEVMKALWTESAASFHGSFWRFNGVPMEPKPVQRPHPPLWFGAHTEPALRRAVKYGDGWMGAGSSSTATFLKESGLVRRFLAEAGRDPAKFSVSKRVYIAVDDQKSRAERRLRDWFSVRYKNAELAARVSIWGSREECVDKLTEVIKGGANHLLLNPVFDEIEHIEVLANEVIPHL